MGNSAEMSDETNYAIFKGTSACWIGLCACFLGETFRQLSSVRPNAVSSCTVMKVFGCVAREDEGLKVLLKLESLFLQYLMIFS